MCPFCYMGKRKFETAVAQFPGREFMEIEWKSFQLDPTIPTDLTYQGNLYQYFADTKGMSYEQTVKIHDHVVRMAAEVGLDYRFDKARVANSFKAHRLIQLAKTRQLGEAMEERLFHAYFTEGRDFGDTAVLLELGKDVGLTEQEVTEALTNEQYAQLVKRDIQRAGQIGVNGVPFFVFNNRYAVSGAQAPQAFLQVLERSFAEWQQENPGRSLEPSS